MALSIIKFGVNGLKRIRVLGHRVMDDCMRLLWKYDPFSTFAECCPLHLSSTSPRTHLALLSFLQVGFFLKLCLATSPWDITDALQRRDFKHDNCQMYSVNTNTSLIRFCVMRNTERTACRCKDLWITQDPRMMRQTRLKSAWKPSRIFHNGIYPINYTKDRMGHCSFCKYQPWKCPWLSRVTQ